MIIRQAISTKYIGPTNFRGSRVRASAPTGSLTIEWNHALNSEQNHAAAARAFAQKYSWHGRWFGGGLNKHGYVFVLTVGDPATPRTDDGAAFVIQKGLVAA